MTSDDVNFVCFGVWNVDIIHGLLYYVLFKQLVFFVCQLAKYVLLLIVW